MAARTLLDVGDRLRREEIPADDVIVLPEGGELEPKAVRPVLLAFARMRRHERKIARLYEGLHDKRRSAASRQRSLGAVEAERAAIQKVVADMPLKPALIDELVAMVRRQCQRLEHLGTESRRGRTATASRDLRTLQQDVGLPRRQLQALLKNPGIIRNQQKILAAINNAKQFLEVREEFGSFDHYIWRFVGGKPIVH